MNIFVLDNNPIQAAIYNNNQHCSKIVLEIAQMMACAFPLERLNKDDVPKTKNNTSRKHSYFNNPITKWVRESEDNFGWAYYHAIYLDIQRRERKGDINLKTPEHFSLSFIKWCKEHIYEIQFPKKNLTPFTIAISEFNQDKKVFNKSYPIIKKYNLDAVKAYRLYYKLDKSFSTWTGGIKPSWMDLSVEQIVNS